MFSELEFAARRFAVFNDQVIAPAALPKGFPLHTAAFQTAEPIPYDRARRSDFAPVEIGWRWGPVWSTAWFRLTGPRPAIPPNCTLALRFSCSTEALLWIDGVPWHGLGPNHDLAPLETMTGDASSGEIELLIEAACNRPLGATFFWWDAPELVRRWNEPQPGCLERAELVLVDECVWRLWKTMDFARQLLLTRSNDEERARRILDGMEAVLRLVNDRDVAATAAAALAALADALRDRGEPSTSRAIAVGHAHIDTAWLWRTRETRRKCLRTFATMLRLMERHPDFRFACSQPQQYRWVEKDAPALFEQIRRRVREGRWEAIGAMWVEPDCNLISGESLVRQIIHGTRYFREAFGDAAPQRIAYLPDTFGFPGYLPQVFRLAGLDTFITNKLCWNDHEAFPHISFVWRGIDGAEILAHQTPGRDYNSANTPPELLRGEKNAAKFDRSRAGVWLHPFGYGDGGGGPNDETIEFAKLSAQCAPLPRITLGGVNQFCDDLHKRREELRKPGADFPVWDGELYLQNHRGTYTTQAATKRLNHAVECALRTAEALAAISPAKSPAVRGTLEAAWKQTLLGQFHDILPGSSIPQVYEDNTRDLAAQLAAVECVRAAAVAAVATIVDTRGLAAPLLVFNPTSQVRSGVVSVGDAGNPSRSYASDVPALGFAMIDGSSPPPPPVQAAGRTLSNGLISVTLDNAGRIAELRCLRSGRIANARRSDGALEPLNQLVLYEDYPRYFEAWDIDDEYRRTASPLDSSCTIELIEHGPLRARLAVQRSFGASSILQEYVLDAGSPRIDIHTTAEWREQKRLLRALFPVAVRARSATYDISFGHIERPTHRNTAWERGMFEVCAHRWMNLAQADFGVALLSFRKYGFSCEGHVMGLSLLRGPMFPDPAADQGSHEFSYSLLMHDGGTPAAALRAEADALNEQLEAAPEARRGWRARHCATGGNHRRRGNARDRVESAGHERRDGGSARTPARGPGRSP
ncbi:MAG: alpha-mannosidase [Planctomycetes bacterium]|nr:alpha-mannosidase [Planctomycetota bacterium]